MDGVLGVEIVHHGGSIPGGLDPSSTANESIKSLLNEEFNRAQQILTEHKPLFIRLVDALLAGKIITPVEFMAMFPELPYVQASTRIDDWKKFKGGPL